MEEDWDYILSKSFYEDFRLKILVETCKEADRLLERLESEMNAGYYHDALDLFCKFRERVISAVYLMLNILETFKTKDVREDDIKNFRKGMINLVEYLSATDSEAAMNDMLKERPGGLRNQTQLMKEIIRSYFYNVFRITANEIINKQIPKIFVKEALKNAGLIPKLRKLEAKE